MVATTTSTNVGDSQIEKPPTPNEKARHARRKRRYKRKRIPETEKESFRINRERQAKYEQILSNAQGDTPSIWSFESLFPDPVWDEVSVEKDLYGIKKRDNKLVREKRFKQSSRRQSISLNINTEIGKTPRYGLSTTGKWSDLNNISSKLPYEPPRAEGGKTKEKSQSGTAAKEAKSFKSLNKSISSSAIAEESLSTTNSTITRSGKVDFNLTRMVEDRIYGFRRTQSGEYKYDTSLMGDGAVKFRDGVRLGNALNINADRLNYFAKKELQHGRIEEALEMYEKAIEIDPRDGRAYLGISRCAERRRDFKLAQDYLKAGIANSVAQPGQQEQSDRGANPFLLQALGCLEEKRGSLSEAEANYIAAAKSRPSHAAAWISLAQLRTRKLGQSTAAGRACFQEAELQLKKAGRPASSYVYTAWAALENEGAGDTRRARELFEAALKVDPKCSAALLQLGVMEAHCGNWDEAKECFEKVLKFDQRNTRVLQAYAIMETKRPGGSSRKAINLFERALQINPRDAGVLQPYALYVAELGDVDAARELLRRGTEVNKRHAPVWQAWGVLEMRHGTAKDARNIFQQGIWACAQLAGVQSGGYGCARLWQAWGVLEAKEGDIWAARRCFSRALDADSRNVATIIAWAQMEELLENQKDARMIFESSLKRFSPGSDSKMTIWRAYENMEKRIGNTMESQLVYQRSMRDIMSLQEDPSKNKLDKSKNENKRQSEFQKKAKISSNDEIEVIRWGDGGSSMGGEVWMNDGSIEGKVPKRAMKTNRANKTS